MEFFSRQKIGTKIRVGFFLLVGLILINGIITIYVLSTSMKLDRKVTEVLNPTQRSVAELELFVTNSKEHCKKWVQEIHEDDRKFFLAKLDTTFPELEKQIMDLAAQLDDNKEQARFKAVMDSSRALLQTMEKVVNTDLSMERIDELYSTIVVVDENITPRTEQLLRSIASLSDDMQNSVQEIADTKVKSFRLLEILVYVFIVALIVLGILISRSTEKSIVGPIKKLKAAIDTLRIGAIPEHVENDSQDEVGEMSVSVNRLIESRKQTANFAEQIGREEFSADYTMLSGQDILGASLINMRDNLKVSKEELEAKQEALVEVNDIVQNKNKKITESINYAEHIQKAILPTDEVLQKYLPESFIYYVPRDVVSGDFPWLYRRGNDLYVAAVDCTGHGVPGALLSFVGYFSLNEILGRSDFDKPADILDELNRRVNITLRGKQQESKVRDGMDIALCKISLDSNKIEYAGAYRPLYHISQGKAKRIKGDSMPIGRTHHSNELKYTNHEIEYSKGDTILFFSDGLPDQFGGSNPDEDQYLSGRVKRVALENLDKPIMELKEVFRKDFEEWKGDTRQTDDVLLIGVRF